MHSALSDLDYACTRLDEDLKSLRIGGTNGIVLHCDLVFCDITEPSLGEPADDSEAFDDLIPSLASLGISQDSFSVGVEKSHHYAPLGTDEIYNAEWNSGTNNKNAQRYARKEATIPFHYFVRISPVALKAPEIQPSFDKLDNFQLVTWKSPEGRIRANISCDEVMEFIDPAKDGAYMIQCINHYMEFHSRERLFLYIRAPDNDAQLGEIGEHLIELCGMFAEFQECFEEMDVAWHPVA